MFRKITSLLLVLSISFSLASCAALSGFKQMIPELVKMEGYLAIEINDAYYSIPNDPYFDDYTIGTLSYNCSVIRHEIASEDYFLVPYGDLPPADYILLIPAQAGSDTLFVQAEYTVK